LEDTIKMRNKLLAICFGIMAAVGVTVPAIVSATPAHAITWVGMCDTQYSGDAYCLRNVSTPTDFWPRDVAGDQGQQYLVTYSGTVSQLNCFQGTSIGHGSDGVYEIQSRVGNEALIGTYSGSNVGYDPNGGYYALWAWFSNGKLANCGQSQYYRTPVYLKGNAVYTQMTTSGSAVDTWTTIGA
jgi:hypothetical protein